IDTWYTGNHKVRKGDCAIVWKAQGKEGKRGIIALAEILTDPKPMTSQSEELWLDIPRGQRVENRVYVKYRVPDGLPIWVDGPFADFLKTLKVFHGQGTVFRLDKKQWEEILQISRDQIADEEAMSETENTSSLIQQASLKQGEIYTRNQL